VPVPVQTLTLGRSVQGRPITAVEFGDLRSHQVRLEGGDASSDFYCYP